ncbi:hypothetical protein QYF36_019700 [Acer negundo]|nr:hypothetical protein QYF36_019700 [Acer negundo]
MDEGRTMEGNYETRTDSRNFNMKENSGRGRSFADVVKYEGYRGVTGKFEEDVAPTEVFLNGHKADEEWLSREDPIEKRGTTVVERGHYLDGVGNVPDPHSKGPTTSFDGSSSTKGSHGKVNNENGPDSNRIGFHIDLSGGLELKGLLKCSLTHDSVVQSGAIENQKSGRVQIGEENLESPIPSKGRRGGKQCYSTKRHGIRTRNGKLRDLEA